MRITTTLLLAVWLCGAAAAQTPAPESPAPGTPWSLDDCIGFAQRNNIGVQQTALKVEQGDIDLSTARYSRLPNLNASLSGDAAFGRVTSSDNTYKNNNQQSASLGASASMPLFQGFKINRQIRGGKLDLAAAVQELERIREDVAVNVMTLYLDVLYNKEQVGICERQLALSTAQAERSRTLFSEGKQPESAWYESESVRANDALTLTQSRNELQLALLKLSQALNRESAAGFDILTPSLDSLSLATMHRLVSPDAVYSYAAEHRPGIRAARLRLESSQNAVGIARSALYPSLSLDGGYRTGVYNGLGTFGRQFRNNSNEYVGVSLNIPIFNRRATRNNIRTAQLAARDQQLTVTDTEQSLRKEIEQAWQSADAAYAKYRSAESALDAARIAFSYTEKTVAAGRATIFDFNDAKTRMEKAESELVRAKYEFVFRSKILDYYRGAPLRL